MSASGHSDENMSGNSNADSRSPTHSPAPRRRHSRSRSRSYSRRRRSPSGNGYEGSSRRTRRTSSSPMSNRRRHMGSRDDPEPSKCVGIFGLSVYTTERQLTQIFDRFGPLDKVQVVLDAKTGRSRGFAFVYFTNIKDATEAKEECSGMEIDGRRIRVDYSITQRAHTPTPGIYMGRPTTTSDRSYGASGYASYRGGSGYRGGDRYRSPSPRYRSRGSSRRDSERYERRSSRDYDRYEGRGSGYYGSSSGYDRSGGASGYDRSYDRSRSRSRSPRRYRY